MSNNILLLTDVYKLGHMSQYRPGTTKVYSYLIARSDKKTPFTVFFGLQAIIKKYLSETVTEEMVSEFVTYYEMALGPIPSDVKEKLDSLAALGYLPLEIKAVAEGTVMPVKNVLMTITNTVPGFHWVVGFFESLVLKVWNSITVASYSMRLRNLVDQFADETCGHRLHCDWSVHDFGYRGCSSEETAAISGGAHLINFRGTDTIPALKYLVENYNASGLIGASVPASEHSVMCSYERENEIDAFKHMLETYPTGIVSIVSDTYDLWNVLTNFTVQLKDQILARDGKVVFRPDSGQPELIICGNPDAPEGTAENKGAIRILDEVFGSTVNALGYKEINPKVGLIYGDGMYFERFSAILQKLKDMGYATSNLVVGIGGLLLQSHSRDDQGFAIKATYAEINGEEVEIVKDPITDPGKKSHEGLLRLDKIYASDGSAEYVTYDEQNWDQEKDGLLETVFLNGKLVKEYSLDEIRARAYS